MKKEILNQRRVSILNRVKLWTRRSRADWEMKGEEQGQLGHRSRRGAIRPWNHVVWKRAENPGPGSPLKQFERGLHSLWSLREASDAEKDKERWHYWDSRGRIQRYLKKSGKVSSKGVDRMTVGPRWRGREGHCPVRGLGKNRWGKEKVLASSTWIDPVILFRKGWCSPGTTAAL